LEHENSAPEEWSVQEQLEDQGRTDLVWHVGDAQIEEGQLRLQEVADEHLQLGLQRSGLDTLLQFGSQAGVNFAGNHLFRTLQHPNGHVSRTGTNFQHHIGGPEGSLLQHGGDHQGILQNMLAKVLVEDDSWKGWI